MEIIEKEKIKEIPAQEYCDRYGGGGYGRRDVNGKANAGLTLGIIGTALGAWALFGNRRGGGLLGGASGGLGSGLGGANININGLETGLVGGGSSRTCPTAYEVQTKECEDVLALQAGIYNQALNYQNNRFADREVLNAEIFGLYKSNVDANFGLYKSTRDGFDILNAKQQKDAFELYKSQRDGDDSILKELSDLKAQVAINAAVRPYQDKLIQCEIDRAFTAGINYTDRKTCNVIYGQVCLPNEPTITGYVGANQCGCPRIVAPATTPAT